MAKAKKKTQQAAALKRKTNSLKARIAAAEVRRRGAPPAPPLEHRSRQEFLEMVRPRNGARHGEPRAAERPGLQRPAERRQLADLTDDDLQPLTVSNRPRSHWARKLKREHGLTDHVKTIEKQLRQRNLPPKRTSLR